MNAGRFAPSPTGELHLGNLRTALLAWLSARTQGLDFLVRMEDLDRVTSSAAHERAQLDAIAALGIDWDGEVVRQSERFGRYDVAIDRLLAHARTYECFCTRREIRKAAHAPHDDLAENAYPGTCRDLSVDDRRAMRSERRRPALRLRADSEVITFVDDVCGEVTRRVDDVVLRRNDGVPAYNLAVVVDDAAQGVVEVVR
ncbi:MAG TPA: glutamate--tRNA ligase family protein, partial [Acidimicrobiia bacterium]|nr:glutamate--tRNA ligase family protein [Acidimicrobiia bacterium]